MGAMSIMNIKYFVEWFIYIVCIISLYKSAYYIYNLSIVRSFLKSKKSIDSNSCSMLILIPVIREQKVIINTIEHFLNMRHENIIFYLAIAGTNREKQIDNYQTTKQIVEEWIINHHGLYKSSIADIFFTEIMEEKGDRATQLNYAVQEFKSKYPNEKLDYIGVYDADSLPSVNTILEVSSIFLQHKEASACQQPVNFVKAANRMAVEGLNPILVANAIYQSTWTMIRELHSWIKYSRYPKDRLFPENVYLIGHGEFLRASVYEEFKFPEFEITDGIQLGYRLSMSNKRIMPLTEFCDDDVPRKVSQLINQHKRWFGGCMNIYQAYVWSKMHFGTNAIRQMLDAYWSQFCWGYASFIMISAVIASMLVDRHACSILCIVILVYCYVLPYLAHSMFKEKLNVRWIDWIVLPIAIAIKGIGPNLYFYEKLFCKEVKFVKVER